MVIQADDRRLFERFLARFPAKYQDCREDFGSNVFLRDISAEGAKIATKEPMLRDDKVDLLVELPDGHEPMALSGHVAWVNETNPHTWDVGLRFEEIDLFRTHRIFKYCLS